ncbi:hypothetical protein HPB51_028058 [Rhipicephalus microplus]|uniref:HTH CENPB-type domain-containing protein n=1 Tax=Rhipicephalus microplus TaxID=6941 RepID=A0A9J6CYL2_RHIMP|nr:hypothetical protein HPB51_028058 [Rhipicephalus microplus]
MATHITRRFFRGPKSGKFTDIEMVVLENVKDMRKNGCAVLLDIIRTQTGTASRRLATKDFSASSGWTTRFMRQNALSLRWRTSLCQRLPSACKDKVIDFNNFRGHLVDIVRTELKEWCTEIAVIHGGLTSLLQPLHVSLNETFKENVRKLYAERMEASNYDFTPNGKIRRPSVEVLCSWILEMRSTISDEVVVKSFKKTYISNALGGMEGNRRWDSEGTAGSDRESCGDDTDASDASKSE